MRVALMVFPRLFDTHSAESASSDLGQRLEPSVLALASRREGDSNEFIPDNEPRDGVDLYLCSVYTRGWDEFRAFSAKVGRSKIIAGGYHPTARPLDTLAYARKVVTGLCGNIEEIIEAPRGGVIAGAPSPRLMDRSLLDMRGMQQVYPDVMPGMGVGSSVSSVGCPYDCDFCATPQMSGRKMSAYDMELIHRDIADLKSHGARAIFIRDESFATHPNFDEAVKAYGAAGFDVLYSFGTAAALNERKMRRLADSGWHSLCLGLEDVGTSYRKNKTLSDVSAMCRDFGVGLTLSFIVNDQRCQDQSSAIANYQALCRAFFQLTPIMVCANFFMPLPGTKLGDAMREVSTPAMWSQFDSKTPLFSTPEMQEFHRKMAVAVQIHWYRSKEYAALRDFEIGDTLHLRMLELEKAFGFERGLPADLQTLFDDAARG